MSELHTFVFTGSAVVTSLRIGPYINLKDFFGLVQNYMGSKG